MTMTRCAICNRPLTDLVSKLRGVGPTCLKKQKMLLDMEKESSNTIYHDYEGGDIMIWKDGDGIKHFNVPHFLIRHSPTGMDWGYGGSGPADLALNILFAVTNDKDIAERFHQEFKWKFISNLPGVGGTIPRALIVKFIEEKNENAKA